MNKERCNKKISQETGTLSHIGLLLAIPWIWAYFNPKLTQFSSVPKIIFHASDLIT